MGLKERLEKEDVAKLDIDSFGEIIDSYIKEEHTGLLIDFPEGTKTPVLKCTAGPSSTIQFYMMLHAAPVLIKQMIEEIDLDPKRIESLVDSIYRDVIRPSILDALEEEEDGENS